MMDGLKLKIVELEMSLGKTIWELKSCDWDAMKSIEWTISRLKRTHSRRNFQNMLKMLSKVEEISFEAQIVTKVGMKMQAQPTHTILLMQ